MLRLGKAKDRSWSSRKHLRDGQQAQQSWCIRLEKTQEGHVAFSIVGSRAGTCVPDVVVCVLLSCPGGTAILGRFPAGILALDVVVVQEDRLNRRAMGSWSESRDRGGP